MAGKTTMIAAVAIAAAALATPAGAQTPLKMTLFGQLILEALPQKL